MVKITYIGKRTHRRLRNRAGNVFGWSNGETRDIEDESLLEKLKGSKVFIEQKEIGPKGTGGGIKTNVRPPKPLSRLHKPRKHLEEGEQTPKKEVKCPKGSYKCKGVCKCRDLKKPKGLRKSKRAD